MKELYLFNNNGTKYAFVAAILPTIFNGDTYYPTVMTRTGMTITDNFEKSDIDFVFERSHVFALDMLQNIPEKPVTVIIYRNSLSYWHGEVREAKASGKTIAVKCNSLDSSLTNAGLRPRMTIQCRKTIYSADCGVVQALWGSNYTATANSSQIFISGITQPDGYFSAGIANMSGQTRRIIKHGSGYIDITHPFTGVLTGTITLYPGCQLTKQACSGFNNLNNGGMFADIPAKNPFSVTGLL